MCWHISARISAAGDSARGFRRRPPGATRGTDLIAALRNGDLGERGLQPTALLIFGDFHVQDHVSARDAIDDIHSGDDLSEDGIAAVQVRLWRVRDEKLAAAGVLAREGHSDRAASVRPGVDFAADLIAGAAFAVAARVAALNDEIRNDAMKSEVVEVVPERERDETVHRDRGVLGEEFDPDLAFGGLNCGEDLFV